MKSIEVKVLNRYENTKGLVYQGLKSSEYEFEKIAEIYFSEVLFGETKGWKKHHRMTMSLFVVVGDIDFYLFDEMTKSMYRANISEINYRMLKVPPGYWMSFEGKSKKNVICNVASIEHDPYEQENIDLCLIKKEDFKIKVI